MGEGAVTGLGRELPGFLASSGRSADAAGRMEAVPRMPMIWLDLKEAGDFPFHSPVRQVRGRGLRGSPLCGRGRALPVELCVWGVIIMSVGCLCVTVG